MYCLGNKGKFGELFMFAFSSFSNFFLLHNSFHVPVYVCVLYFFSSLLGALMLHKQSVCVKVRGKGSLAKEAQSRFLLLRELLNYSLLISCFRLINEF